MRSKAGEEFAAQNHLIMNDLNFCLTSQISYLTSNLDIYLKSHISGLTSNKGKY